MKDALQIIQGEIAAVIAKVDRDQVGELVRRLDGSDRLFVTGEGRSGLMAKAFAMRLMHLGFVVYVIGETTTPAAVAGDTLVAVSGSGTTVGTVRVAEQVSRIGGHVLALTTEPASALGVLAEQSLILPAATKYRKPDESPTVQPLSSLFDQTSHLVLDAIVLHLARLRGIDNSRAATNHANTE